jgi:hypothetical protein
MPFDSGTLAFTRFKVVGDAARLPDQAILDAFAQHAMREDETTTAEVDYGWVGGRHVLDGEFQFINCVFNDCIHVGLRIDTNRVPSELKKAYVALEENASAAKNPSGFASRQQKKLAKESASKKIEEDLASGRFRRSKLVSVLWDFNTQTLMAPVSMSQREQLAELFERTHGLTLEPISSGSLARRIADDAGKLREYEDIVPTKFAAVPNDGPAEYPWTARGDATKDFLGNEFMLWLWHASQHDGGAIQAGKDTATLMFAKMLDLDCSLGTSGRCGLKFEMPVDMPEATAALRTGKVPRKAGLAMSLHGQIYAFNLAAETLAVSGLKLPEVENADSARVLFEERITLLRNFTQATDALYANFLQRRLAGWDNSVQQVRQWITARNRSMQAVA